MPHLTNTYALAQFVNNETDNFFFTRNTLAFFKGRFSARLLTVESTPTRYVGCFVTSERLDAPYDTPRSRRYTVRKVTLTLTGETWDADIETVSEYQQYANLSSAQRAATAAAADLRTRTQTKE